MGSFNTHSVFGATISPLVGLDRAGALASQGQSATTAERLFIRAPVTGARSSGGSSGGSAVAVLAGTVFAAIGTDTGTPRFPSHGYSSPTKEHYCRRQCPTSGLVLRSSRVQAVLWRPVTVGSCCLHKLS